MPNEGSGAPAPAVVTVPPAVPPPAAVAPPATTTDAAPPWLPERLKRAEEAAQAKLLTELGITDPAKAKELIAAANKAEQEAKSTAQRLGETNGALKTVQTELERHKAINTEFAARMMMGLTAEQQAAVKAIAGDDAATQLKTITALTPTWAAATPAAATAVPAPKPTTPAAGTAPPPVVPTPALNSPPDHAAVYAEMYKTNPFAAAQYGLEHASEVFKTPT